MSETPSNKRFWKSKKFIAWLIVTVLWKALTFRIIWTWEGEVLTLYRLILLETLVVCSVFIDIGYIGGQTWLDSFASVVKSGLRAIPGGDDRQDKEAPPQPTLPARQPVVHHPNDSDDYGGV